MMVLLLRLLLVVVAVEVKSAPIMERIPLLETSATSTRNSLRGLTVGDFAILNTLLDSAPIRFGNVTTSRTFLGVTVDVILSNLLCNNLYLGDLQIDTSVAEQVQTTLLDMSTNCTLEYAFSSPLLNGAGPALLSIQIPTLVSTLVFFGTNLASNDCSATVNIPALDLQGTGAASSLLQTFHPIVVAAVAIEIQRLACANLAPIGSSFITNISSIVQIDLGPYLNDTNANATYDPVAVEQTILSTLPISSSSSSSSSVVGLLETSKYLGGWMDALLRLVDILFTSTVDDPTILNTGQTTQDLGINVLLRSYLLNDQRQWTMKATDNPFFTTSGILYKGSNRLTNVDVIIDQISVLGLDTIENFPMGFLLQELTSSGATVQTAWDWKNLTLVLNVILTLQPSTASDSLFVTTASSAPPVTIQETITATLSAQHLATELAFLIPFNPQGLQYFNLGQVLFGGNFLACLMDHSIIYDAVMSGWNVSVSNLADPILTGFNSPGMERWISDSIQEVWSLFLSDIMTALPVFFQTKVRQDINTRFDNAMHPSSAGQQCLAPPTSSLQSINPLSSQLAWNNQHPSSSSSSSTASGQTYIDLQTFGKSSFFKSSTSSANSNTYNQNGKSFLDQVNGYLNESTTTTTSNGGQQDLQVNKFLRSTILQSDGSLSVSNVIPGIPNIRILGLDTITQLNVLNAIAPQTVDNTVVWDQLGLELDWTLSLSSLLSSSSSSSSSNNNNKNRRLQQSSAMTTMNPGNNLTVTLDLTNVKLDLTFFLAVSQDSLQAVTLGSLSTKSNVFPCLISAAVMANVPQLNVTASTMPIFNMTGLPSPQLQQALTEFTTSLSNDYSSVVLDALPVWFDGTMRIKLNDWITKQLQKNASNMTTASSNTTGSSSCPLPPTVSQTSLVDFRDLLLSPSNSLALGGSGTKPYGDLISTVYTFLRSSSLIYLPDKSDQVSLLNNLVVDPWTTSQSGMAGTYVKDSLINVNTRLQIGGLNALVEFQVLHVMVQHLNTVGAPLTLLEPMNGQPNHLYNVLSIGGSNQTVANNLSRPPLILSTTIVVAVTEEGKG